MVSSNFTTCHILLELHPDSHYFIAQNIINEQQKTSFVLMNIKHKST